MTARRLWAAVLNRARVLFRGRRFEAELDEELRFHLEEATARNLRRGMTPSEAARAARRDLGGVERTKEQVRDETGVRWLQDLGGDVSFAFRMLRRRAGFSAVVIVTIAVCVAAWGGVSSIVQSILLQPLPFPESGRIVSLFNSYPKGGSPRVGSSVVDYEDFRVYARSFEDVALFSEESRTMGTEEGGRQAFALAVTPSFFRVLRATPALGRLFDEPNLERGGQEVILGNDLWSSAFGGRPDAVGSTVVLDGAPYTVVGVLPASFRFASWNAQLFVPLTSALAALSEEARQGEWWPMIGRLADGASLASAQAEIDALTAARLAARPPELRSAAREAGYRSVVRPYLADLTRDVRRPLFLMWVGVFVVLVIGGANVTSLFLVGAQGRAREIGARLALGAGAWRIVRQMVTESLVLATVGGVIGLFCARWSLGLLHAFRVYEIPRVDDVSLGPAVLGWTVLTLMVLGASSGAFPALALLRPRGLRPIRGESRGDVRGTSRLQRGLVSGQIALAFVLVMGAALLVATLRNLAGVERGFDAEGVAVGAVTLPSVRYPDASARLDFVARLFEEVDAVPGVRGVAVASQLPFSGGESRVPVVPEDGSPFEGEFLWKPYGTVVTPGYFDVMDIEKVAGRDFAAFDDARAGRVAIVDEVVARRYWPDASAVGRRFTAGADGWDPGPYTVVGVVRTIKQNSLMEVPPAGAIYLPLAQNTLGFFRVAVRHEGGQEAVWPAVKGALAAVDPGLSLFWSDTMEESISASLIPQRTPMQLLSAFAVIGLLLGALGVYGVMAYVVGARRREIGLRMAVGGSAGRIVTFVAREWAGVVGIGVAMGIVGALASTRALASLLYGTGAVDLHVMAVALATILVAALAACIVPVRRALRVDPATVLREE